MNIRLLNLNRWVLIGIGLVCAIALNACSQAIFKTEAAQVSQIVISTLGDFKTFNYAFNGEFPYVFLYTDQGLVGENGETGKIEPALAESWEISPDKQRITLTLRDGLKWSDGKPITVRGAIAVVGL